MHMLSCHGLMILPSIPTLHSSLLDIHAFFVRKRKEGRTMWSAVLKGHGRRLLAFLPDVTGRR